MSYLVKGLKLSTRSPNGDSLFLWHTSLFVDVLIVEYLLRSYHVGITGQRHLLVNIVSHIKYLICIS
jgi:hypothetical protein